MEARITRSKRWLLTVSIFSLVFSLAGTTVPAQQPKRLSPSETVRQFYSLLREKKYKEAFQLSVFSPAVEKLTPELMKHLEPDFQAMAAAIPETIELGGENITGSNATVYVKVPPPEKKSEIVTTVTDKNQPMGIVKTETRMETVVAGSQEQSKTATNSKPKVQVESNSDNKNSAGGVIRAETGTASQGSDKMPIDLILVNGRWLIGDTETQQLVAAHGVNYFFLESAGIIGAMQNNEGQIASLLSTLLLVEQSYATQNQGVYLTLPELVNQGYLKEELMSGRLYGYTVEVELSKDRSKFVIFAVPDEYNKTGRFSYFADPAGIQLANNGGQRYKPTETAKPETK
ncbi:MAG: hypothetical protein K1Y36_09785 [Blastocatellia bacterium]|nr:hypothetical protein [Blastocatellia bacterium]